MFAYILPEGIKIDAYMYMHGALVYKSCSTDHFKLNLKSVHLQTTIDIGRIGASNEN